MGYTLIRWSETSEAKLMVNLGTGFGIAVDCPPEVVTSQVEVVVVSQGGDVIDSEAIVAPHLACVPAGNGLVDVIVPLATSLLKIGGLVEQTSDPITSEKGRADVELRREVVELSAKHVARIDELTLHEFTPTDPRSPVGSWVCWVIRCAPEMLDVDQFVEAANPDGISAATQ